MGPTRLGNTNRLYEVGTLQWTLRGREIQTDSIRLEIIRIYIYKRLVGRVRSSGAVYHPKNWGFSLGRCCCINNFENTYADVLFSQIIPPVRKTRGRLLPAFLLS
jgi:hypothetical protein